MKRATEVSIFRFTLAARNAEIERLRAVMKAMLENDGSEGSKRFSAVRLYDARQDAFALLTATPAPKKEKE